MLPTSCGLLVWLQKGVGIISSPDHDQCIGVEIDPRPEARLVEPLLRLARGERSQRHQNFGVVGGGLGNLGPGEKCRNIHDFVGVNAGVRTSHMVTGQFPVAAQSVNLCSRPVDQRPDDLDLEPIHLGTGALDGRERFVPGAESELSAGEPGLCPQ